MNLNYPNPAFTLSHDRSKRRRAALSAEAPPPAEGEASANAEHPGLAAALERERYLRGKLEVIASATAAPGGSHPLENAAHMFEYVVWFARTALAEGEAKAAPDASQSPGMPSKTSSQLGGE